MAWTLQDRRNSGPKVRDFAPPVAQLDANSSSCSLEKLVRYSLVRGLGSVAELGQELRRLGGRKAEEIAVTAGEKLLEQGRKQGLEEGLEQGLEQGLLEGERRFLRLQLCKRFGLESLPRSVEHELATATQAQLESWAGRVLDAKSLDEVFES